MTAERPEDILIDSVTIDSPPDEPLRPEQFQLEADGDLVVLEDGRTKTTLTVGDAELTLVYNRDSQQSAEAAAVLLMGAPQLVTSVEQAYDEGEAEDD